MGPRRRLAAWAVSVAAGAGSSREACDALLAGAAAAGGVAEVRRQVTGLSLAAAAACSESLLQTGEAVAPARRAWLLERFAEHPGCLEELATKGSAEVRCPLRLYKAAIQLLLGAGDVAAANGTWLRARALRVPERPDEVPIAWPSVFQTPTTWMRAYPRPPSGTAARGRLCARWRRRPG